MVQAPAEVSFALSHPLILHAPPVQDPGVVVGGVVPFGLQQWLLLPEQVSVVCVSVPEHATEMHLPPPDSQDPAAGVGAGVGEGVGVGAGVGEGVGVAGVVLVTQQ